MRGKGGGFLQKAPSFPPAPPFPPAKTLVLEQFHIENVDCSGSRESDYPQPNTRKNHAFSVV